MATDPAPEKPAEASGGIQSLDAALRVLLAMARLDGPVALSELARECDMPVSKVHRYLASFLHAGLAKQAGRSGKYDLGATAIEMGLAALHRHDFVNWISEELPALALDTGMTALLCVWGNSGATIVRWERAPSFVITSLGLGTTLPLLTSATGRAFLAYLPEAVTSAEMKREIRLIKTRPSVWPELTPDPKGVRALAGQVRAEGIARVDGRFIPGLVAVAAPVLDWQGQAVAVVTLIGTDPAAIEPDAPGVAALRAFAARHSLSTDPAPRPSAAPE